MPYKDVAALVKGHINAQKLVGMDKLPIPKADAPKEQWDEVWNRLGRPQAPDGYKLPEKLPEGIKVDEGLTKDFFGEAHRIGLTSQQAAALVRWQADHAVKMTTDAQAAQAQMREKVAGELRKEWGQAFDQNLGMVREAVRRFGGNELMEHLEATGMGNDPQLIRLLHKVGKLVANDEVIGGGGRQKFTPSPDEARKEIARRYADPGFTKVYMDKMHPDHKAAMEEMRQLHQAASPS